MFVVVEVPEPSTASRPLRERRPPSRLKDYECEKKNSLLQKDPSL